MLKKVKHFVVCSLMLAFWMSLTPTDAQTPASMNQRDAQGRKQGYWESHDQQGRLVYTGFFKDDKPTGELKRYYPKGSVRVIMTFRPDSKVVSARFFWQNGDKAAVGNYIDNKRDSIWEFYSYSNKSLTYRQMFYQGKRNGKSISYYPTGAVNEVINWVNDKREGRWQQFYEDGKLKLVSQYLNNELEGAYTIYYPDGQKETVGFYHKGLADGEWKHLNPDGSVANTVIYRNGVAQNTESLTKTEQEWFRKIEKATGTIKEPDETDFMGKPQGQ